VRAWTNVWTSLPQPRGREEIAKLTEREKALSEGIGAQTRQLNEMQKKLTTEFENIAVALIF
jgi:hypothetical protein